MEDSLGTYTAFYKIPTPIPLIFGEIRNKIKGSRCVFPALAVVLNSAVLTLPNLK